MHFFDIANVDCGCGTSDNLWKVAELQQCFSDQETSRKPVFSRKTSVASERFGQQTNVTPLWKGTILTNPDPVTQCSLSHEAGYQAGGEERV